VRKIDDLHSLLSFNTISISHVSQQASIIFTFFQSENAFSDRLRILFRKRLPNGKSLCEQFMTKLLSYPRAISAKVSWNQYEVCQEVAIELHKCGVLSKPTISELIRYMVSELEQKLSELQPK
jgi:hypothetical protein